MLSVKYGYSETLQELCFNGDWLRDDQKLIDCATLHLILQIQFVGTKLYVKLPWKPNSIVFISTKAHDTVRVVKVMIQTKEGISSNTFMLIHSGELLEDEKTLASLNIQSESTLHVVLNLKDVSISVKLPKGETVKLKAGLYKLLRT